MLLDLVELVFVVKSHVIDRDFISVFNVRGLLARVGEYDSVRGHAQVKHLLYLIFTSAVKSSPQEGQELEQHLISIAFYGVVGLDSWELCYPVYMLVANVFQIDNVKWIIFCVLC